ncbi:Kelch motif family protein [Trichomonas vaginalis G3]|uniref:Kelch motif family protein n=1 Tax=Trichomonas vaginalis (strain ATCC PRA-98 / G3) TaxID=412133 RepID=A2F0J5_TRIV3|nr:faciogenital dysplasia protein family [Trichomonas vaginalis G3]EAY01575.1 Kelch motif family protein [Trichomonas vaginalis G3]KAI5529810.1 faciogenital dysplasia protein family [Trichomonas vaginalis G3]|eukprot:XP_001314216.1 Kelch motif family protein [Trichomonas vaginalis G3]
MHRAFACFTKPGAAVNIFPATKLKGKTVAELKGDICKGFDFLGVRYGSIQEAITDDIVLLDKYPLISRPSRPSKYCMPDYTIIPLAPENQQTKWILCDVKVEGEYEIPKFLVKLPEDQNATVKDFLKIAQESIGLENEPIKISIQDEDIPETTLVQELYKKAWENQVIYHMKITEKAGDLMQKRSNIVQEIKESEAKYISQLKCIIEFWTPEVKKRKIFNETEMKTISSEFGSILNCHQIFLDELTQLMHSYSTQVAGLFVSHSSMFEVAITYIANYPQINDTIVEKCKSNSVRKELLELSNQQNGQDFLSFLITPVQRIPRYQLFIRDLTKYTPSSHPDSFLLKEAANSIEAILRKIEVETKSVSQMWRLKQIEKNLVNKFKIVVPNRKLIHQAQVAIKGHSENIGMIYVFNDIVLVTKDQSKGITVLFDSPVTSFHYQFAIDNDLCLIISAVEKSYNKSIMNPRKDYLIGFADKLSLRDFFQALVTASQELTKTYEFSFEWALMNTKLSQVSAGSAAANGSEFLFFGGQPEENMAPGNTLTALNQFTMERMDIQTCAEGRVGHTMTLIGSRLFIIGGKNKNTFFDMILCYDLRSNIWSEPLPNSTVTFEPRYGHTTTLCDGRLYIIGGRNQKGDVIDTVTVFDPIDNMFEILQTKNTPPPARYHHVAVLSGHSIIIHGGKAHKKLLSDTWELDTETMTWQEKIPRGDKIIPRKCGGGFVCGDTMIFFGGTTESGAAVESIAIKTDTYVATKVVDVGNVPYALRKFSYFTDRSGKMYAYGGMEKLSKTPYSAFYLLKPNQNWLQRMLSVQETPYFGEAKARPGFGTGPRRRTKSIRLNALVRSLFAMDGGIDQAITDYQSDADMSVDSEDLHPPPSPRDKRKQSAKSVSVFKAGWSQKQETVIPEANRVPLPDDTDTPEITPEQEAELKPKKRKKVKKSADDDGNEELKPKRRKKKVATEAPAPETTDTA